MCDDVVDTALTPEQRALLVWTPCGHCYCLGCFVAQVAVFDNTKRAELLHRVEGMALHELSLVDMVASDRDGFRSWEFPCATCRRPVSEFDATCALDLAVIECFVPEASVPPRHESALDWSDTFDRAA